MIKTKYYGKNGLGVDLYRTYSDENKYILQIETGIEYDKAIDVGDEYDPKVDFGHESEKIRYTYDETNKDIEIEEEQKGEKENEIK
jgi:hypothetical protein